MIGHRGDSRLHVKALDVDRGLSLKAVSRQTAALFREMRRPSRLRDLGSAQEQSVGDIAGLVLKDVLEVEVGGEFLSGAEAYPVIKGTPAAGPRILLPKLERYREMERS